MADPITFTCTLARDGGHIPIPFDQRARFGRARPPVIVTINGYRYRSTIAIMSGETFVPLRRSHRGAAGIGPGDTVEVTLASDTGPRIAELSDELAAALDAAAAHAGWDRLGYSCQREWVEAIGQAKRPETRAKRIAAAVEAASKRESGPRPRGNLDFSRRIA